MIIISTILLNTFKDSNQTKAVSEKYQTTKDILDLLLFGISRYLTNYFYFKNSDKHNLY